MTRGWLAGWLLILGIALAFRLPDLGGRPLHNDEGVNALKLRSLLAGPGYRYDPHEFHGPSLPYASWLPAWLTAGRDFPALEEGALRIVPVAFGVGLLLLFIPLAPGLGRPAAGFGALLMAVSPAMVFYSRYYIHEMLLVFFTGVVGVAAWRYGRKPGWGWAVALGLGVGLMHATKETFVFPLAALGAAVAGQVAWNRWVTREAADRKPLWRWSHAGLAVGVALAVSVTLFTSFFTNPSGPLDSLRSYLPWFERAGGESPHIHPWYFYLRRLVWFQYPKGPWWSEGAILLLGIAGAVPAFGRGRREEGAALVRGLAVFSLVLGGIYTVIPYKTPWCLLGFWHGMVALAGVGGVGLWRRWKGGWGRVGVAVALGVGVVHLGWQAWRGSFPYAASPMNPYVYAHTSPDLLRLVDRVRALTRLAPEGDRTLIKVMSPKNDFWPLPWYFRGYSQVGYWGGIPADPWAPIMVVGSSLEAAFDERPVRTHLMAGYFQLRPQVFLELYVEVKLWRAYVETLPKDDE